MNEQPLLRGMLLTSALATGAAHADAHTDAVLKNLRAGRPHVANELLVQYRPGHAEPQTLRALGGGDAPAAEILIASAEREDQRGDLAVVRMPVGQDLAQAVAALSRDDNVEFVEPNWILHHAGVANDPYYMSGQLWGMYGDASVPSNIYGSQAGELWSGGADCREVYVGVIDEGIMTTHEDLAANVWVNPYDPPDGIDNDGNGYVDDTNGWDFNGNDNSIYDGPGDDHGSHVAGTIAAIGGNGKGVAGICWNARLISAKFLGDGGGTTANAVKAIDYITNLKRRHGLNIVATNNSWGGGGSSRALADAIERANQADILFVAAAGNSGQDIEAAPDYPARYPNANIIAVAALAANGTLASFSNYGRTSVDLAAPGVGIISTIPGNSGRAGYAAYSGTSMATPHVTGAAALYAATHPGASAAQIKAALFGSAAPTPALAGKTVTGGRLDVSRAVTR